MELKTWNIIVGTAGHIDHGKTALVRALTGVDADRLPEEKRRGITIDLGFAELDLATAHFGFVDVPGHERFVKNMLAGASGIDLVALIIAADAGVMPQTREHFDICRLLGVKSGLIVITKIDLVDDDELLELVKLDAAELVENSFLEHAPVVQVSAKTGDGIENLKQVLLDLAGETPVRDDDTITQLPIDRAFSVKGFGAVVTGTLAAGEIRIGDELELLPAAKKARVRGLQNNNRAVETVRAGQRAAVNLGGVETSDIERGQVLTVPHALQPTQIVNVEIEVLPDAARNLKSRQRVRVHIGTSETSARVQILHETNEIALGETGLVQLRLEKPIVAAPEQRFIIRSYSPQRTIAGGQIIENSAQRARRKEFATLQTRLQKWLAAKDDKTARLLIVLETGGTAGLTETELQQRTAWRKPVLQTAIAANLARKSIVQTENRFVHHHEFEKLLSETIAAIKNFHRREPLARGISRETLREQIFAFVPPEIFRRALEKLIEGGQIAVDQDAVRLISHNQNLQPADEKLRDKLKQIYDTAEFVVPTLDEALAQATANTTITKTHARKIFQLLLDANEIARVTPELYFSRRALEDLRRKLRVGQTIDVAEFKTIAGISRKYAIPLLEFFDRERWTRRVGDKREIL